MFKSPYHKMLQEIKKCWELIIKYVTKERMLVQREEDDQSVFLKKKKGRCILFRRMSG